MYYVDDVLVESYIEVGEVIDEAIENNEIVNPDIAKRYNELSHAICNKVVIQKNMKEKDYINGQRTR